MLDVHDLIETSQNSAESAQSPHSCLWGNGGRQSPSSAYGYPVRAFLVAQTVKNLPAMQETWVKSLGWADPLEKEMATHSSILA